MSGDVLITARHSTAPDLPRLCQDANRIYISRAQGRAGRKAVGIILGAPERVKDDLGVITLHHEQGFCWVYVQRRVSCKYSAHHTEAYIATYMPAGIVLHGSLHTAHNGACLPHSLHCVYVAHHQQGVCAPPVSWLALFEAVIARTSQLWPCGCTVISSPWGVDMAISLPSSERPCLSSFLSDNERSVRWVGG